MNIEYLASLAMSLDRAQVRREDWHHPNAVNGRDQKRHAVRGGEIALEAVLAELEGEVRAREEFLAPAARGLGNPRTPSAGGVELLLPLARGGPRRISPQI